MRISMRNFARLHTLFGFVLFSVCMLSPVKKGDCMVPIVALMIVGIALLTAMYMVRVSSVSDDEEAMWVKAGHYMERGVIAFLVIMWLVTCILHLCALDFSINMVFTVPMAVGAGIYMRGIAYLKLMDILEE